LTLTTRLLVFFQSMLAMVLIGFSVALYLLANQFLYRQASERLDAILNTLSAAVEVGPEGVEWEAKGRFVNFDLPILANQTVWFVADGEGTVLDQSNVIETDEFRSQSVLHLRSASSDTVWKMGKWQAGYRWIHAATTEEHDDESSGDISEVGPKLSTLSITAAVSLVPVRTSLRQLAVWLLGLSLGIWCIAFLLGRILCKRALSPVRNMAVAAGEMNASDLQHRLPEIQSHDELEDLNRSFNGLLDRLQQAFEQQRRFTGDASHQLRTPLTAILGQIDVALRRERNQDEYRRVLAKVHDKASHLNRIVESLLFLSRTDSDAPLPTFERIDLNLWLTEYLESWSEHDRYKDILWKCSTHLSCFVNAQPVLLGELLNILLDNACKYSSPNSPIEIVLQREGDSVCVSVRDLGHGISDADIPNLFVPFCRSDDVRQRGIQGIGLGLSIAKRLSGLFAGNLHVTTQINQGTSVTLRLPASGSH
jgi:signal transduction histidine kinase